ncbi:hypothetical protein I6N90_09010 [Paenibacillus sp. GSMTC-2017]|uniref:hypothetical protein n=1 Tax=Paenibacillus sp. GSMTC-2017 TaxID=2794350 RepID=UPI0018D7F298|nr:hypothetical protein [Paenibacillus sp. GSMTC-2017]MBH5317942.1 hypothetical protein [Paenibacillus sp. GSMTC-2017]
MNCESAVLRFSDYAEMSDDDNEKMLLEEHLLECEDCAQQFEFWQESELLIRQYSNESAHIGPSDHVNRTVMERIYMEQSWYMPIASKSYQFSKSFRRNVAILIAGCMAMFACAFFIFLFENKEVSSEEEMKQLTGIFDAVNASGDSHVLSAGYHAEIPVASISDPFVLTVVPSFPQYYVALSLLGLVMALLMLNWLSRTRN